MVLGMGRKGEEKEGIVSGGMDFDDYAINLLKLDDNSYSDK